MTTFDKTTSSLRTQLMNLAHKASNSQFLMNRISSTLYPVQKLCLLQYKIETNQFTRNDRFEGISSPNQFLDTVNKCLKTFPEGLQGQAEPIFQKLIELHQELFNMIRQHQKDPSAPNSPNITPR